MRDSADTTNAARRRKGTAKHRRAAGLAVVAVAAAVLFAGCGGAKAPAVASLATTTSSRTAGSSSSGNGGVQASANPGELLVKWAACMRSHGDSNQADPTIDAHKVIHIPWNSSVPGGYDGTNKGGHGNNGPGQYCRNYLAKAQSALQAGRPQAQPSTAQLERFSKCMRANGISSFPDPTANGLQINRADMNPNNPAFQRASKLCSRKTGVPAFGRGGTAPGTIQLSSP